MASPEKSRYREWDGFVFAYELTSVRFSLKLFRVLPLASIRLADIRYIRQRASGDLGDFFADMVIRPFRRWYWPHPLLGNAGLASSPYIISTRRDSKIYVRLKIGFHYRLRARMGEARGEDVPGPDEYATENGRLRTGSSGLREMDYIEAGK